MTGELHDKATIYNGGASCKCAIVAGTPLLDDGKPAARFDHKYFLSYWLPGS
jgi:hypothetical protein